MVASSSGISPVENPIAGLRRHGQAIWLDFIRRSLVTSGDLERLVENEGVAGITSNPTIFEKAIDGSDDYTSSIEELRRANPNLPAREVYERLVTDDIRAAADTLRSVYDRTGGADGYVSIEVSPGVANDTQATIAEARHLWQVVGRPNVMIKVPGTEAGVPAVRALTAEGINVNITLLFGQARYASVALAYIEGLEDRRRHPGGPLPIDKLASVASFFVSRIDTKVDALLTERIAALPPEQRPRLERLLGKVAIANARLAYQIYKRTFAGPRWEALAAAGAHRQRLLWASTSVKNPRYRDVLYVEELIGPDTVDTMPLETLQAFRDHGHARPSLETDLDEAAATLDELEIAGISLLKVTDDLLSEGLKKFQEPFDKLLGALERRCREQNVPRLDPQNRTLPPEFEREVQGQLATWGSTRGTSRLFAGDPTLWDGGDELGWIGWLSIVRSQLENLEPLLAFEREAAGLGLGHAVLLGMGGSSLSASVFAQAFTPAPGHPELIVLDSTDPAQIRAVEQRIDLDRTLFIVASKSGSTLEPNILAAELLARLRERRGAREAGERFVVITDPGSSLESWAREIGCRRVFPGVKSIGGRYSALSNFGLVPAAVMGLDLHRLLDGAEKMLHASAPGVPTDANPALVLGTILGLGAKRGLDKLTLVVSPAIAEFGAWAEQLVAESTGKDGKGIIPIAGEPIGPPEVYGRDRLFVYQRLAEGPSRAQDEGVHALEAAGRPVVRVEVPSPYDLGEEMIRWEMAVAIAGSILGINPFNQPDVEASKLAARALTAEFEKKGRLPAETPFFEEADLKLFADGRDAGALGEAIKARGATPSLVAYLRAHLERLHEGDYFALLAFLEARDDHEAHLQRIRQLVRDRRHVATALEFGPRFLHSTGQAYKGGPPSGLFVQITADVADDLPVPERPLTFGVVESAQARGDLQVLAERHRPVMRVHLGREVERGLARLESAFAEAVPPA